MGGGERVERREEKVVEVSYCRSGGGTWGRKEQSRAEYNNEEA